MTSYEEYTLYLISVPAVIMARLILHQKGIDSSSVKGALLYLGLFTLFLPIFAAFVFFIRYMRGEVSL